MAFDSLDKLHDSRSRKRESLDELGSRSFPNREGNRKNSERTNRLVINVAQSPVSINRINRGDNSKRRKYR